MSAWAGRSAPPDSTRLISGSRLAWAISPARWVFFRENGMDNQITHVAMYSGNGYVLHASAYYAYQQVVESKMENIEGYAGARRIRNLD